MTPVTDPSSILIRPVQYRDLENIDSLTSNLPKAEQRVTEFSLTEQLRQARSWYGLLKFLSYFPNPFQHRFSGYVAEWEATGQIGGFVQVAPFNSSRSTWRVERVLIEEFAIQPDLVTDPNGIGSQLLRFCFERIWEARTWLLEIDIEEKNLLALYRQNGFQPLAQMTYWSLPPELLAQLAENDPDLPNLLPVSNADAQLLYQLDCVSMPPLMRQVFDRHTQDFKSRFVLSLINKVQHWCLQRDVVSGYVFEPQRKAAIGYFKLILSKDGSRPHQAELTVHPAYTWLYPKLLFQMARLVQDLPDQSLELVSADYQHEREEYLGQLGAQRIEHTLLMSRSVWHKLKETKLEKLQLSEMLQSFQPIPRTPIPSRITWFKLSDSMDNQSQPASNDNSLEGKSDLPNKGQQT
ncbi:MAG: GNAT family N-acetyltransferase [Snowella sp.]|nr:GNAT family N-acetyltransferase [Snowella sp.]